MNKTSLLLLAVFVVVTMGAQFSAAAESDVYSETINLYKESPQAQPFFANSYGYAVFPSIAMGGLVVGGAYGIGHVYQAGKVTGTATLVKASIGFQAGGQAYSQMIFFQDKRAYDEFTSGEFMFDVQASAVVLIGGAQARTGTTGTTASGSGEQVGSVVHAETEYRKGMAIFVHIKGGAMFEAVVAGQKFTFEPW